MQVAEKKLPHLVTALPGPKAKAIVERDRAVISTSYTRDYPLVAKTGRGALVDDADGNTFLDFAAGIAVVATGHCHPEISAAVKAQVDLYSHTCFQVLAYEPYVELAERLGPGRLLVAGLSQAPLAQ